MSDLIDRKEAIDALERSKKIYFDRQVIIGAMKDIVRNLPSAQPESAKRTAEEAQNVSDSDLISRKAAIDEIDEWIKAFRENGHKESAADACLIQDGIIQLPSAQPGIVKCKDCKHYGCILHSGTQFEYGECFGHEESDYIFEVKPDDYCSRAERRTDE